MSVDYGRVTSTSKIRRDDIRCKHARNATPTKIYPHPWTFYYFVLSLSLSLSLCLLELKLFGRPLERGRRSTEKTGLAISFFL